MKLSEVFRAMAWFSALLVSCMVEARAGSYVTQGVIVPEVEAVISAPIAARVATLSLREGDAFAHGDVLLEFDCTLLHAESEEARALLASASARHDVNRELGRHGAIGSAEIEVSRAEVGAARAKVRVLGEREKHCRITAPFSGRVVERLVNLYETPPENGHLLRVIDTSALEIEMIAPSRWLRWLRAGAHLTFEIGETGATHPALITRIGAAIDPVSQTVSVYARFAEPLPGVLAGMSGQARFDGE